MPDPTPAPIPLRLVYRALADACGGQARHLGQLAAAPGPRTEGRRARSDRLRAAAAEFSRRIGDPAAYQGPGLDAAVVGYLVALCYGHTEALPELRAELADLGRPGLLHGLTADDLVPILDRLRGGLTP